MPKTNFVKLDNTKIIKMAESLRGKYITRVGVLGDKDNRDKDFESNASIGAKHEFGSVSERIPKRSFLRMPLEEKLPEEINKIGDDVFKGLTEDNIESFYLKLGIKAEEIIQEAFNTGGFGKWPALSERTIKKKGHATILIDTTQLRKAVTSEAIKQ